MTVLWWLCCGLGRAVVGVVFWSGSFYKELYIRDPGGPSRRSEGTKINHTTRTQNASHARKLDLNGKFQTIVWMTEEIVHKTRHARQEKEMAS